MKKEKAIEILEDRKSQLKDVTIHDFKTWVAVTNDNLKKIFPQTSESKSEQLDKINYASYFATKDYENEPFLIKGKNSASKFIDDYVKQINHYGLEKANDDNPFISLLKNIYFYIVLAFLGTPVFLAGKYYGETKYDKDKIEMAEENTRLKNQIESGKGNNNHSNSIEPVQKKQKQNNNER